MTPTAEPSAIRFESIGVGTELWGGTQANFLIVHTGHHAKEAAVVLNTPAAAYIAEFLGEADTPEFRALAAQHVGRLWLEHLEAAGRPVPSLVFLSKSALEAEPALLEQLRPGIGRLAPQRDA